LASVNTFPPPTGTSAVGPSTVPLAGALEDGAELVAVVGALVGGAELVPVVPAEPASSPPPHAARIGALAPASATIAAQRSTDLRSRSSPAASVGGGVVGGAMVSSLMNLDLRELPVKVVERFAIHVLPDPCKWGGYRVKRPDRPNGSAFDELCRIQPRFEAFL
jgi:hypothetical protein